MIKRIMACLLFGIVIFAALKENYSILGYQIGGLIWNRNRGIFMPIENVSTFRTEQQYYLSKSRELEIHDFKDEIIRIAFYEEQNIFSFYENDTKVTGVFGELWTMMADYLNFTLVTTKAKSTRYGALQPNGSYDGLLGMVTRDEIDVIPRSGFFVAESKIIDYTTPLWENRYRLFMKPEIQTDPTWMLYMFSQRVWYSILVIFVFMSVLGYTMQRISLKISDDKHDYHTLNDHFFYTFGTFCCQGFIPDSLYRRTKILGLSKKMFSWLLLITLSSHLISYMTDQRVQPPFDDIDTMFNRTTYNIVVFNGSMVFQKFKGITEHLEAKERYKKRFFYVNAPKRLYEKGCWGKRKYVILDSENRQRAYGRLQCNMVPIGIPYFATWIAAGVSKTFKYKRSLDIGILKLNEFGLTDGLRDRWMATHSIPEDKNVVTSVDFDQVFMLITMLFTAMLTAFVILFIEKAIFYYDNKRSKLHDEQIFFPRPKKVSIKKKLVLFLLQLLSDIFQE